MFWTICGALGVWVTAKLVGFGEGTMGPWGPWGMGVPAGIWVAWMMWFSSPENDDVVTKYRNRKRPLAVPHLSWKRSTFLSLISMLCPADGTARISLHDFFPTKFCWDLYSNSYRLGRTFFRNLVEDALLTSNWAVAEPRTSLTRSKHSSILKNKEGTDYLCNSYYHKCFVFYRFYHKNTFHEFSKVFIHLPALF